MKSHRSLALAATAFLAGTMLAAPAPAAEVTPDRLVNADREPQNWLMNHRTYNGQRFSPLDLVNKGNVKGLHLAFAVALGGGAGNEYTVATPLAEDGFLYTTDSWGVLYKIDVRAGDVGRIVWRMDPKQERQLRNRGAGDDEIAPQRGAAVAQLALLLRVHAPHDAADVAGADVDLVEHAP